MVVAMFYAIYLFLFLSLLSPLILCEKRQWSPAEYFWLAACLSNFCCHPLSESQAYFRKKPHFMTVEFDTVIMQFG